MRLTIITIGFFVLSCLVHDLRAQTNEPVAASLRQITLEESIQLALQQNLSLKMSAYNPQIARYTLSFAYGAYDPLFRSAISHRFSKQEGGFDSQTGETFASSESESDVISSGLSGVLPTGLTYDLGGSLTENAGLSSRTVTDSNGIPVGTLSSSFNFFEGNAGAITLSQPLLRDSWIDATRREIKIEKRNLRISELGYSLSVMDVVTRVENSYYELIFAIENVEVQKKALELAERSVFEIKKKVEVGTLAPLDERQAEAEVASALAALIDARYIVTLRQNVLKSLITDNYGQWHSATLTPVEKLNAVPQVYDLGASWLKALAQRPDYQQQMLELEKADISTKFWRNQLFPRLNAFGSYGHSGLGRWQGDVLDDIQRGSSPNYSLGLGFSVPLWRQREKSSYRTAKALEARATLAVKQFEQSILVTIDDAINRAKSRFQKISATRQARIFAEAALDAEQKKFQNGKSTGFEVLRFQRDLTTSRSEEIRALADYNQALAELYFLQGATLDRHQIHLHFQ